MEVSVYSETGRYWSGMLSSHANILAEQGTVIDLATTLDSLLQFQKFASSYPELRIGLWPIFSSGEQPPFAWQPIATGEYWITAANFRRASERIISKFVPIAASYDNVRRLVLDIETPMSRRGMHDELSDLVDELKNNGIEVKVTFPPITPLDVVPENADIISMQKYTSFSFNDSARRVASVESACRHVKHAYKDRAGIDIGGFTSGPLKIGSKYLKRGQPEVLEREIEACRALRIKSVGVHELPGLSSDWLTLLRGNV